MKSVPAKITNSRICALLIGFCLLITFLMFGANFNHYVVPYPVFITILVVCAVISVLCYLGFVYWKILNWKNDIYNIIGNIIKFFFLAVIVFFIVEFPIGVISNRH